MSNKELEERMTKLKKELEFEKFTVKNRDSTIEKLSKVKTQLNVSDMVFRKIYELVLYELQPQIHELDAKTNALLFIYANKTDPKRFPMSDIEREESIEIMKDGYEAFLNTLKEDVKVVKQNSDNKGVQL